MPSCRQPYRNCSPLIADCQLHLASCLVASLTFLSLAPLSVKKSKVTTRGGVENTRLEAKAKAKDTKKIRGQGQGQPFRGQTLSRPRTGMLEAKAKDQGHKAQVLSKKKKKKRSSQKFFRRSPKRKKKKKKKKRSSQKFFRRSPRKNAFQKFFNRSTKF